jgi:hypothetical protein
MACHWRHLVQEQLYNVENKNFNQQLQCELLTHVEPQISTAGYFGAESLAWACLLVKDINAS